jgi:hypothetical protein
MRSRTSGTGRRGWPIAVAVASLAAVLPVVTSLAPDPARATRLGAVLLLATAAVVLTARGFERLSGWAPRRAVSVAGEWSDRWDEY